MKKEIFKLGEIKKIKVVIDSEKGQKTLTLLDKEQIRQTLVGNPFLKDKVSVILDDLKGFDMRNN